MAKNKKTLSGLEALQADLQKKYGESISDWNQVGKVPRIPTDAYRLDKALGGGLPEGRVIEVFGPESSGKTSLALFLAGVYQKNGFNTAYIDQEHAIDPQYSLSFGYDPTKSIFSQPDYAEQALDIAIDLASSGQIRLICLDSVAALSPRAEVEGEMGDAQIGLVARLMSKFMRKITPILRQNNCTLILINQTRVKIGGWSPTGAAPEDTTGGKAIKFFASIRCKVTRGDGILSGKDTIGMISKIKMVKNKTAPPFQTAEMKIIFGQGYQVEADWVDACIDFDIIKKGGAWFSIPDTEFKFQGREKLEAFLYDRLDVFEPLKLQAKDLLAGNVAEHEVDGDDLPEDLPSDEELLILTPEDLKEMAADAAED